MADRKVYVSVTTRLILRVDEGASVDDIMGEMNYDFSVADFDEERASIEDTEITEWHITDSK